MRYLGKWDGGDDLVFCKITVLDVNLNLSQTQIITVLVTDFLSTGMYGSQQ